MTHPASERYQIPEDFRLILKRELEARCQNNPRYSLRAFAADLELSPARLSEILNGRQGLSRAAARKVAHTIGLNPKETDLFCDLVDAQHARAKLQREMAKLRLEKLRASSGLFTLEQDAFHVVSDWYHFAIFQLIRLDAFRQVFEKKQESQSIASWISSTLEITLPEAQSALDRLKRLGIVTERNGTLTAAQEFVSSPGNIPSVAIRKFHRQVLQRAILALDVQPAEERDFSTQILAVDSEMLPKAKKWIRIFRKRFTRKLTEGKRTDRVYALSIQFFKVARTEPDPSA